MVAADLAVGDNAKPFCGKYCCQGGRFFFNTTVAAGFSLSSTRIARELGVVRRLVKHFLYELYVVKTFFGF